jgi:lipoprotein NlpD
LIRQPIGANAEPSWQWPLSGQIIRGFENGQNKGIDIGARLGDPVYAASDGDVVYSGRGIQGAGELIILRHSDRYLSAYAYNSAMRVKEGDRVRAGQQIAEVGASSAGDPALHFEIRVDGKSVDPTGLLPRR